MKSCEMNWIGSKLNSHLPSVSFEITGIAGNQAARILWRRTLSSSVPRIFPLKTSSMWIENLLSVRNVLRSELLAQNLSIYTHQRRKIHSQKFIKWYRNTVLEPAPQGMGAPQTIETGTRSAQEHAGTVYAVPIPTSQNPNQHSDFGPFACLWYWSQHWLHTFPRVAAHGYTYAESRGLPMVQTAWNAQHPSPRRFAGICSDTAHWTCGIYSYQDQFFSTMVSAAVRKNACGATIQTA